MRNSDNISLQKGYFLNQRPVFYQSTLVGSDLFVMVQPGGRGGAKGASA